MFYFGDPSVSAQIFLDNAQRVQGPTLPAVHYDEMSVEDVRNALTYIYLAYMDAEEGGASPEIIDILVQQYDEVFEHLAAICDEFREACRNSPGSYPGPKGRANLAKYRKLAGVYSES